MRSACRPSRIRCQGIRDHGGAERLARARPRDAGACGVQARRRGGDADLFRPMAAAERLIAPESRGARRHYAPPIKFDPSTMTPPAPPGTPPAEWRVHVARIGNRPQLEEHHHRGDRVGERKAFGHESGTVGQVADAAERGRAHIPPRSQSEPPSQRAVVGKRLRNPMLTPAPIDAAGRPKISASSDALQTPANLAQASTEPSISPASPG